MKDTFLLLCKAIGSKCDENDKGADLCCYMRIFYIFAQMAAVVAIIANAIHQW